MHFNALPERHHLRWVNFCTLLNFLYESTEATNASWNAGHSNTFPENFGSCNRGNFTPVIFSVIPLDDALTPFFAIKSFRKSVIFVNEIHPTLSEVGPSISLLQHSPKPPLMSEHSQIRNHSISSIDAQFSRMQFLHSLISPIHCLQLSHFSPESLIFFWQQ